MSSFEGLRAGYQFLLYMSIKNKQISYVLSPILLPIRKISNVIFLPVLPVFLAIKRPLEITLVHCVSSINLISSSIL